MTLWGSWNYSCLYRYKWMPVEIQLESSVTNGWHETDTNYKWQTRKDVCVMVTEFVHMLVAQKWYVLLRFLERTFITACFKSGCWLNADEKKIYCKNGGGQVSQKFGNSLLPERIIKSENVTMSSICVWTAEKSCDWVHPHKSETSRRERDKRRDKVREKTGGET